MSPTGDYLSFLFSLPNVSATSVLCLFLLGLMRIAPIVAFAPFLGARMPGASKMGLAIAITIISLPYIALHITGPVEFNFVYLGLVVKELFIGIVLSILVSFPFYVGESAGVLIDFQRGSSSLMVQDPTTEIQVSPIGLLYNYTLIVLFFYLGGPTLFFEGVVNSYGFLPVNQLISPTFFNINLPFWQMIVTMLTKFTAISIQLAAPSLVAILMAEMFLGIANRLAPQVQIAFLGMAFKSLLGIALLFAGWFFILQQMGNQTMLWIREIGKILYTFGMQ